MTELDQMKAALRTAQTQRNQANDQSIDLAVMLAIAQEELAALKQAQEAAKEATKDSSEPQ